LKAALRRVSSLSVERQVESLLLLWEDLQAKMFQDCSFRAIEKNTKTGAAFE
jgi:hypothetical protein